jgi:stage V sporulation protein B
MALPVLLFPCALLGAFAGLLIPEVTEAHVRGEHSSIRSMTHTVFRWTLLYAIGASGLMIAFSHELGMALYDSHEAAVYIRLLAPLVPVMYMDSATDAILKGLGEQVYSMKVNIIDAAASLALVWLLTPMLGIMGYIIAIYATEILNAAMSIVRLLNRTDLRPAVISLVIKPLVCIVGATSITRLFYALCPVALTPITQTAQLVFLFLMALFLYAFLLHVFGALRKQDTRWIVSFFIKT